MTTAAIAATSQQSSFAHSTRIYAKEIQYEFLKTSRNRMYSISTISFPVVFYFLFGIANRHAMMGDISIAKYLLASYCCFGVIGAALFGIGVGFANERSQGWLEVKRASPMPSMAYIVAKLTSCIAFGWIVTASLMALGIAFGGVHLTMMEIASLFALTTLGSLPFAAMGLLIGLLVPANAAPGIINLIYLPMSFCSGLWMPLQFLPHWVQTIAPFLPAYHYGQMGLEIVGFGNKAAFLGHFNALLGFTFLFLGLSWLLLNRSNGRA
ncbi:MAG TPA: ABC transporter permease [Acidobacteriaceae bacterium]|jgi:ABC-2 type transport system permease protein|nr:ABC transporter permease [Acidobacteriaceae bacterium]